MIDYDGSSLLSYRPITYRQPYRITIGNGVLKVVILELLFFSRSKATYMNFFCRDLKVEDRDLKLFRLDIVT